MMIFADPSPRLDRAQHNESASIRTAF